MITYLIIYNLLYNNYYSEIPQTENKVPPKHYLLIYTHRILRVDCIYTHNYGQNPALILIYS